MSYIYNPFTGNLDYYEKGTVASGTTTGHGYLTGLSNDDHPQYHTNVRGDVRYYTKTLLNAGQLDDRYYTESEVDTISGSLQTDIDGKSDVSHIHDAIYYTETELNNGQLDTRYYTETEVDALEWVEADITDLDKYTQAEVDTISGSLQTDIDGKSDVSHIHDARYYTETELNNGQLDTRYYTETEVDALEWVEADITDLDKYTQAEVDTISGSLQTDIDAENHWDRTGNILTPHTISGSIEEIDNLKCNSVYIPNNTWSYGKNAADSAELNMFKVNTDDELETGIPLNVESIESKTNSGAIILYDMTVTSGSPVGTEQSASINIDGNNFIKFYSESDGAGGIQNERVDIPTGIELRKNGLSMYANNATAVAGGLAAGDFYRTNANPSVVCVVY